MRTFAVGLSILLVSAGALAFSYGGGGGTSPGGTDPLDPPPPPANTVFAGVLQRIGLGADALAAAGVTSEQVPALVGAVEGGYNAATLAGRDEGYIAARQAHDRLKRLVQSGKGTSEDVTALRSAEATLATATSARASFLADLRQRGLATLSSDQRTLLERIRANQSWSLPVPYLAKDRTEAEWVRLRDSLAAKRISEQDEDEPLAASAQSHLAAVDAEGEIATAKVNLDSNHAAVQTAWNLAAQ